MRFASILMLCMLSGCSSGGGLSGASKDDACTVALRFTEGWLHERGGVPVVFSHTLEGGVPLPISEGWQAPSGGPGEVPPPAMLAMAARLNTDSAVVKCSTLRAYLDRMQIPYGAAAEKAAMEGQGRDAGDEHGAVGMFSAEIFELSVPGVSADGTMALIMTGRLSAPELGGGSLLFLKRQPDGSWREVSNRPTWAT
jgi:hypothetical protein